jgi:hypothetical protein
VDPGVERDRNVAASERVYRALMRAYPEEVRRRYADEMVGYFGDLRREEQLSRGPKGVALLWARALPELILTALRERGALFRRNAYLPASPGTVARWGALCALVGGILGVAFHLIEYSLLGALGHLTGGSYISDPFTRFFTFSLLLSALSLSSLGLFGLYGAVVARSGRPGLLAGAGAISSVAAASLWLTISGYSIVHQLASGTTLFAPFEWVYYAGSLVIGPAMFFWFLGLFLLGVAAALQPLPRHLRVLPLALFALIVPSYLSGGYFEMMGGHPVVSVFLMGLGQGLPFVGVALLGWALLRGHHAEPLAVPNGPAEGAGAPIRTADGSRSGTSGAEADKEKELLRAIRRHGQLTVAGVALETSLSVEEADRMLSTLAGKGHLEVRAERARLLYSLLESHG